MKKSALFWLLTVLVTPVPGIVLILPMAEDSLQAFAATPAQPPPSGGFTFIENPSEEPNPLTQPFAAKITNGNLVLNVHFPAYEEPVWLSITLRTPAGDHYCLQSDDTFKDASEGSWWWRENVTAEQVRIIYMPAPKIPGQYCFFSEACADQFTTSQNWWGIYFCIDVANQPIQELAQINGKVTDEITGEPISGTSLSFEPGTITLTSQALGAFSSSEMPAGTYSVQISAPNYNPKTLSGIALAPGLSSQLNVSLAPYAPQVISAIAAPSRVGNDGQSRTFLSTRVTHPHGLSSLNGVLGDLSSVGGSPEQHFYDDGTHGDLTAGDGTYSYEATVAAGTSARLYPLNIKATDEAGKEGFGSIILNVTDKLSGTVEPPSLSPRALITPLAARL
jgi:hypothetical protein